jgi:zona occludens toxin
VNIILAGIPGHGKTLYAVSRLAAEAAAENRPVFYHGIPDCKVPGWTRFDDPREWYKLPQRSVIIIDEAHEFFPQRGPSQPVPPHVFAASVLRKQGHDLVLITQDGNSIDHFVRRRVGRYLHFWRSFGMQRATVWEFPKFVNWEDYHDRQYGRKFQFAFPKEAYALYKSAEVHTVKRKLPAKLLWFPLGALGVVAALTFGYKALFSGAAASADKAAAKAGTVLASPSPSNTLLAPPGRKADTQSPREFLTDRIPRFQDFPESAPLYDSMRTPAEMPLVSACVASGPRCVCYSQQGTRLSGVSKSLCRSFVAEGAFNPYRKVAAASGVNPGDGGHPHIGNAPRAVLAKPERTEKNHPPAEQLLTLPEPEEQGAKGRAKRAPPLDLNQRHK